MRKNMRGRNGIIVLIFRDESDIEQLSREEGVRKHKY